MYKKTVVVNNKSGLHARPGSVFVTEANKFASKIKIRRLDEDEDEAVNAKSIAFVLSLGIAQGVEVELSAVGDDAQEAVDSLCALIESGLGDI